MSVFIAMSTQWRAGAAGPIGLDYNALPAVMRLVGVSRKAWPEVFDAIRVMEDSALEMMRATAKQR